MKKLIPNEYITNNRDFHRKPHGEYTADDFRSLLFGSADPSDEYIYDYDGLKEWFYSCEDDDEFCSADWDFDEYLSWHIDRTIDAVSVPKEIWEKY